MGSEDFGHLADSIDVPSMFWFFGGQQPMMPIRRNHSPRFCQ